MSIVSASHLTQLLYFTALDLNLAQIVSDLRASLVTDKTPTPVVTWACDDIAIVDTASGRIVLCCTENLPGPHKVCLTVAAGPLPPPLGTTPTTTDHEANCRQITALLHRRFPADAQRSQCFDAPLTTDLIDEVVDSLFTLPDTADTTKISYAKAEMPPAKVAQDQAVDPSDMDRLMHRLSSELTTRPTNLIARAIASATSKSGRNAIPGEGAKSAAIAPHKTPATGGFLRHKGGAKRHAKGIKSSVVHQTSPNELKAVREALCASNLAQGSPALQLAARARQALQTLVAVPAGFASALAIKQRNDGPTATDRRKH